MRLFYDEHIAESSVLNEEEARHALKVLRLSVGDAIRITNGKGQVFTCILKSDNFRKCEIKITETEEIPTRSYSVHIALAPTKNLDRTEFFVEKAVEMGIEKISFFTTKNSERKVLKTERVKKIAVSAMKQSGKYVLPEITELESYAAFLEQCKDTQKFIAHLVDNNRKELKNELKANNSVAVIIGPEGDFTETEIEQAFQKGFVPVSLGPYRLRTETAALAACHTLNLLNY